MALNGLSLALRYGDGARKVGDAVAANATDESIATASALPIRGEKKESQSLLDPSEAVMNLVYPPCGDCTKSYPVREDPTKTLSVLNTRIIETLRRRLPGAPANSTIDVIAGDTRRPRKRPPRLNRC